MSSSRTPKPLRAKLTVVDLSHEIHNAEADRKFMLQVMDDSFHPSTSYSAAGKTIYIGPHHKEMLSALENTFMGDLEYGNTAVTREHLMKKLSDKL
jgi:hypothetical protein